MKRRMIMNFPNRYTGEKEKRTTFGFDKNFKRLADAGSELEFFRFRLGRFDGTPETVQQRHTSVTMGRTRHHEFD